jgi:hypothetical protein
MDVVRSHERDLVGRGEVGGSSDGFGRLRTPRRKRGRVDAQEAFPGNDVGGEQRRRDEDERRGRREFRRAVHAAAFGPRRRRKTTIVRATATAPKRT